MSAEAREASFGLRSRVKELLAIRGAQGEVAAAANEFVCPLTTALSEEQMLLSGAYGLAEVVGSCAW